MKSPEILITKRLLFHWWSIQNIWQLFLSFSLSTFETEEFLRLYFFIRENWKKQAKYEDIFHVPIHSTRRYMDMPLKDIEASPYFYTFITLYPCSNGGNIICISGDPWNQNYKVTRFVQIPLKNISESSDICIKSGHS